MADESDLQFVWEMIVEQLPHLAQTHPAAISFLSAVLKSLREASSCLQVSYLRFHPTKDSERLADSAPRELPGGIAPLIDLAKMKVFGRDLPQLEGAFSNYQTIRSESGDCAVAIQLRQSETEDEHTLCLVFDPSRSPGDGSQDVQGKAIHLLSLLAYIIKSKQLSEADKLRKTRLHAIDRLLSLTGDVGEVARRVCLIWREWLNVPALRLWVFNSEFKELDLLQVCSDEPNRSYLLRSANRLPDNSVGVKAIHQRSVIRGETPMKLPEWNEDTELVGLFAQLPQLICVPLISADLVSDSGQPRFIGLIDLHMPDITAITQPDPWLLFVGKITAAAFLRARAHERKEISKQLNQFTIDLVNPRDRRRLDDRKADYLEKVQKLILQAVHANCVSIFEADDSRDSIRCVATTGIHGHDNEKDEFRKTVFYRKDNSLTWRVFSTGKHKLIPNINEDSQYTGKFPERRSLPNPKDHDPMLVYPLPGQKPEGATGVIRICERTCSVSRHRLQNFSDHDVDMINLIAHQVSPSLLMIRLQAHRELFVERTAHQVTQPLQGVIAYTDNILEGVYDRDPVKLNDKLRYIRQMAKGAAGMLRSTLWAAGITDFNFLKQVQRSSTKLTSYFLERVIDMQPIRMQDWIKVKFLSEKEADAWGDFLIDEQFFEQVVQNLLHNAVKYSYPRTTVEVKLFREVRTLKVNITSTGVPIDLADPEQIFWDRERGKVASKYDPQGSGQGLYLARQIMRGFGGDVKLLPSAEDRRVVPPPKFPTARRYTFQIIYPEAFI